MLLLRSAVLLSVLALCRVQASPHQEMLAGYQPATQITDLAAIDLDQKKIKERAMLGDLWHAVKVYEEGGYSGSYAHLTLINPNSSQSFPKGTEVIGFSESGGKVSGMLMEGVTWGDLNSSDTVQVKVVYTVSSLQSKYVDCQVGALFAFDEANRKGCFAGNGTLVFISVGQGPDGYKKFNYQYDVRHDNNNAQTIQSFSTQAANNMKNQSGAYYPDFQLFVDYYGDTDYADKWIKAAFNGNSTAFSSGRGNADFANMVGNRGHGRGEAIVIATAYLNVWMAVIFEMERAVEFCNRKCDLTDLRGCSTEAVQALDRAAALYIGSSEGKNGSGHGVLLYELADKQAYSFKTAGYLSTADEGTAYINLEIVNYWFKEMQVALLSKNPNGSGQCDAVDKAKEKIASLMLIPLIQSVLHDAWLREFDPLERTEIHEAAGATFTAALLPYLHQCERSTAEAVLSMMGVGSTDVQFLRVKQALESVYPCLGVTCAEVGGLWDGDGEKYVGEPCSDGLVIVDRSPKTELPVSYGSTVSAPSEGNGGSSGTGMIIGIVLLLGAAVVGFVFFRRVRGRLSNKNRTKDMTENNITAIHAVQVSSERILI